jgi:putative tryptophan/tyrosine transport system ATP-binding protein
MELTVDPFSVHLNDGNVSFTLNVPEFVLKAGECCYVMGHNGSGKSVFLRSLSGELAPTVGHIRVLVDGKEYDFVRNPFPVVRQNVADNLAYDLTVRENLLAKLNIESVLDRLFPAHRLSAKIEAAMSWHKALFDKLDRPSGQLSLGQKQALAFLSVSSANAPLLMLDEFLSSTDLTTSQLLRELIRAYADKVPAAVLVVSHDVSSSMRDADRIIVLKEGAFVADIRRSDERWNERAVLKLLS